MPEANKSFRKAGLIIQYDADGNAIVKEDKMEFVKKAIPALAVLLGMGIVGGLIAVIVLFTDISSNSSGSSSEKEVNFTLFQNKILLNEVQVASQVGFYQVDPFPVVDDYHVQVNMGQDCYVNYPNPSNRNAYVLLTLPPGPAEDIEDETPDSLFMTHVGPCGVCSSLQDLAQYGRTEDIHTPIMDCAIAGFRSGNQTTVKLCIERLGLSADCASIWQLGTLYALTTCPECIPFPTETNEEEGTVNPCDPTICPNTINLEPACQPYEYENGEFRLTECLQCYQCNVGPMFLKIAGRTKANSGLEETGVAQPEPSVTIEHDYS